MDGGINQQQAQQLAQQPQQQVNLQGNAAARVPVPDEAGEIVKLRFQDFLRNYQHGGGHGGHGGHPGDDQRMDTAEDAAMELTTQQV